MHWAEEHVDPMLALRNIICSNRWKEEWSKIEAGIRKQRFKKTEPAQPKVVSGNDALLLILNEKINSDVYSSDATAGSKKTKPNPWRNFKHGKALYQRDENLPKL